MNSTFEKHCKTEGIVVLNREEAMSVYPVCHSYSLQFLRPDAGVSISMSGYTFSESSLSKFIVIGENTRGAEAEAIKWHELGHLKHPYGGHDDTINYTVPFLAHYPLTRELAANIWLLSNYTGSYELDSLIPRLREAILTYIEDNCASLDYPWAREAARRLKVDHLITWVKQEELC